MKVRFGPESNLYGSNAFAAVVNFITRSPAEAGEELVTRVGSGSFHQVHWSKAERRNQGATRITLSNEHRGAIGPYILLPSGQVDQNFPGADSHGQVLARVLHERKLSDDTQLRFTLGAVNTDSEGVVPGFRMKQRATSADSAGLLVGLDLEKALSLDRHLSFHSTFQRQEINFPTPPLAILTFPETTHGTTQAEFDLRYQWEPGAWRLTTGASLRTVGMASPYSPPVESQSTTDFYLRGERELGEKWTVFLGGRRSWQEMSDNVTSWKAATLYRPRPDLGFRLSVGNSFRAPDFFGIYVRNFNQVQANLFNPAFPPMVLPIVPGLVQANPDLVSESAQLFVQAGVEKRWEKDTMRLDFYRARIEDTVGYPQSGPAVQLMVPPGIAVPLGFNQFQFQNLPDHHVRGLTLSYQKELPHDFQLALTLNYQDLDVPGATVPDLYAPNRSGTLLLSRAAHGDQLGGSIALRGVDRYGISDRLEGPGYGIVDVNLEREVSERASVSFTVRNLLDKDHIEVSDFWTGTMQTIEGLFFGRETFLTVHWKL